MKFFMFHSKMWLPRLLAAITWGRKIPGQTLWMGVLF